IADQLNERRSEREAELKRIMDTLKEHFTRTGIKAAAWGRPKHIYSIYRKMERKNVPFGEIYDVRAFRIIVPSIEDCYRVLGIIHSQYRVIPQEFDDYISSPKENAYRSLHTAVIDKDGKTLEVQIRTDEMDEQAKFGIAAHWQYKEYHQQATRSDDALERRLDLIRHMMEDVQEIGVQDANTFVESMMEQISPERIYALTPKGDIIDLPEGATPVDFAFYVHTEVGHRCRGAKVNGRLVALDYQLKNGDRIEITTANRGGPSLDWLNPHLGYIKTTRARNKIKQWFKRRERDNALAAGKEVLDRELRRIGQSSKSRDEIAAQLDYAKAEDLMLALGTGEITAAHISPKLLESAPEDDPTLEATVSRQRRTQAEGMRIDDTEGLLVTLAGCCNPTYGDPIIGFITRGKGITVHLHNCKNVLNTNEPERIINVTWPPEGGQQCFPVPVVIVAYDREGLMRDIGAVIADEKINMSNVNISTRQNIATFELTMEIRDVKQLSRILT
ncbi:MAG: TGS domain-containing protein, partial [Anaerolineae bacterium]|nr:TGS domain-containing protein [Anaerolineae bacterium]